jgi:hypothetical protein
MSELPKVLLVENDEREQQWLKFAAADDLDIQVADHCITGLNRVGLEDFDAVVVDPDVDSLTMVEAFLGMLQKLGAHVLVLQKGNGSAKRLVDSGRFRMNLLPKESFVVSLLADLEQHRHQLA